MNMTAIELLSAGASVAAIGLSYTFVSWSKRPKTSDWAPGIPGIERQNYDGTPYVRGPLMRLFDGTPRVGKYEDYDSSLLELRTDHVALVPEGTPDATGYIVDPKAEAPPFPDMKAAAWDALKKRMASGEGIMGMDYGAAEGVAIARHITNPKIVITPKDDARLREVRPMGGFERLKEDSVITPKSTGLNVIRNTDGRHSVAPRYFVEPSLNGGGSPGGQHRQYWLCDRKYGVGIRRYARKSIAMKAAKRCNDALVK